MLGSKLREDEVHKSWDKLELKKRNENVNNCCQNERGKNGKRNG
jgi:hypothetical protein